MTLASISYAKPLQEGEELERLCGLLIERDVKSYLEIGARYGGSFERIMGILPRGSRGVAVDFPGGPFGDDGSTEILLAALDRLKRIDRDVSVVFGPSASPEVVQRVTVSAPFDAVMIDGDHSYQAVVKDFLLYAPQARIVVVHDIATPESLRSKTGLPIEVPKFWEIVKKHFPYSEIVRDGSLMGFGVLFMRDERGRLTAH